MNGARLDAAMEGARMDDGPRMQKLDFAELTPEVMAARAQEFLAVLMRRRSVRDFSDRAVPMDVVAAAIRTAGRAPSGANQQPWHFAVITDPVRKRRLRELAEREEHEFYHGGRAPGEWLDALAPLGTNASKPFLETAPVLITIFAQRHGIAADGSQVKHYYVPESVGIATGFLIAALHQAGLATLTHTPAPMNFLNEICGRPAQEKPSILLVVGYPAEGCQVPVAGGMKKRLEEIASFL